MLRAYSRSTSVLVGIFHATVFLLYVPIKALVRRMVRFLGLVILEFRLIVTSARISLYIVRVWRNFTMIMRHRLPVRSLRWRYRPRLGDSLVLVLVLLLVLSGFDSSTDRGRPLPDSRSVVSAVSPQLSNLTAVSASSPIQRVRLYVPAGKTLHEVWHKRGLLVHDSLALSDAFATFFHARQSGNRQSLNLDMEFSASSGVPALRSDVLHSDTEWVLQKIRIDLSSGYSLNLVPEQSVFGVTRFETTLHDKLIRVQRFAIEDTVEGLLLGGDRYVRDAPTGRMGDTDVPIYIETLLLFLDRALESAGGLRPGDLVSALYSQTLAGSDLQLLYVTVRQPNNSLEMVYFYQDYDDQGFLYDSSGRAFVLSQWAEPVKAARITSSFGMRLHPVKKYSVLHRGIDFSGAVGTPVHATKDGIVLNMRYDPNGYGRWIRLKHKNGFSTLYAHLDSFHPDIRRGYTVAKSQIIGFLGNSGRSTGPHLHYEVAHFGQEIDPTFVTKPEMRLLSQRQRYAIRSLSQQRREQMRLLLAEADL